MKIRHFILAIILPIIFLSSCSEDDDYNNNNNQIAARFTSSISGQIKMAKTKMAGSSWDMNDDIGVFAKKAGLDLSPENIISGYDNIKYTTMSGSGNFLPASGMPTIYYPTDGSSVDFIAYYPYNAALNNYMYEVNLTKQNPQEDIDLIYSNNLKGSNQSSSNTSLSFTHQLTKLELNITAGSGTSSLAGLSVSLSGFPSKASFDLVNGEMIINNTSVTNIIAHSTSKETDKALSQAMILPSGAGVDGRKIIFTLSGGKSYTYDIPSTNEYKKGLKYTYNITLKNGGTIITPTFGQIETPLIDGSMPNMQYVVHGWPSDKTKRNFALYYDIENKLAHWVAYPLVPAHFVGGERTNAWKYDPIIAQQYQPNLSNSWAGDDCDRGHQLPSADRLDAANNNAVNRTTFYYTNMTAQHKWLNQRVWADLEDKVRTWSRQCDTLYVVTGAMVTTKTNQTIEYVNDKKGGRAAKPKAFYKALAKRTGDTYHTIAFIFDNIEYPLKEPYDKYRLTVASLEEECGFTFFPSISKDAKNTIETSKWN